MPLPIAPNTLELVPSNQDETPSSQHAVEPGQTGMLNCASACPSTPHAVASLRWLPEHLLRQILDLLDGPSRRCFRSIDRHARALDSMQCRADWLVAASRWAGAVPRLVAVCDQSAGLPVPLQRRVLNAVIARIDAVGDAAQPVLRAAIDRIRALPSTMWGAAAVPVTVEGLRVAHRSASCSVLDRHTVGPQALSTDVCNEATALAERARTLVDDVARRNDGALARLEDWTRRVGALMPPSARVPPLKACAAAARFVSDAAAWKVLARVIAPLVPEERADILAAALKDAGAMICFDVVLSLVADLPHIHRDALLAELVWQIPGRDADEQARCVNALIGVAEGEPPAVCADTLIALLDHADMLYPASEQLVFGHADRMLRRLSLSQHAELVARVASHPVMGARLWALSRLPTLAQAQASHAVPKEPGRDAVMPYRAEIVRLLIVSMTGPGRSPPPSQMQRVWPALYAALKDVEEGASEFALAALREFAPHLPEPLRVQANAVLSSQKR